MLMLIRIAASSRSWTASLARVCATWVAGSGTCMLLARGRRRRTIRSLRWGTEDVATATRVGSVGQRAMLDGEKVTQALE